MKKFVLILTMAFGLTMVSGAFVETNAQTKSVTKSKKGWSHRKKYAVIGAGTGAVAGGVLSSHHVTGAVVGGAVGAAGGYILGRHRDKKHPQTKRIYKTKRTY
jgi:uncharacterized protein YcfJ